MGKRSQVKLDRKPEGIYTLNATPQKVQSENGGTTATSGSVIDIMVHFMQL